MNWRKGLFRLWIIGSTVWIGVIFIVARPDQDALLGWKAPTQKERTFGADAKNPYDDPIERLIEQANNGTVAPPQGQLIVFLLLTMIPIGATFAFGGGMLWAFAGFRK